MKYKISSSNINNKTLNLLVLLIDLYVILNTFILSYLIYFNFQVSFNLSDLFQKMLFILATAFIGFVLVGSYKGIISNSNSKNSLKNIVACCVMLMIILITGFLFNRIFSFSGEFTIPFSIIFIHFFLNIIILVSSRFLYKKIYNFLISDFKRTKGNILIYGAGDAGLLTYSVLKNEKSNNENVIGFIDDNIEKTEKTFTGLPVYHSMLLNKYFMKLKKVDEVIVAMQRIQPIKLLEIVDNLSKLDVKVKIVPSSKSRLDSNLKPHQVKEVTIEDFLGREPVELNNEVLQKEYVNKSILVTGAAGSIGSEISRQLAVYGCKELILIDQSESELYNLQQVLCNKKVKNITAIVADVRNEQRMKSIIRKHQPTIIFHVAAYKHVPFMEENPYEAISVNVLGSKIMAELAVEFEVEKFVMISTDKAVNPTNVMGASKRIAELYVDCLNKKGKTKFITTRFGNVLGSNGSVIPLFKEQIKNGGPITVTHMDISRYFMTISEACQLVLEAGTMGNGGELFVFDMGKSLKIYDLALKMIHFSGLNFPKDIDIKIIGLRPGEKIHEELFGDGEIIIPTHNKKIMVVKLKKIDSSKIYNQINELIEINNELDFIKTVLKIKEIVPEFISNNSEYEYLD